MKASNQKINGERDLQNSLGRMTAVLGWNKEKLEEMFPDQLEAGKLNTRGGKDKKANAEVSTETPPRAATAIRRGSSTGKRKLLQRDLNDEDANEFPSTPTKKRANVVVKTNSPGTTKTALTMRHSSRIPPSNLGTMRQPSHQVHFANGFTPNRTATMMPRSRSNTIMGPHLDMSNSGSGFAIPSHAPFSGFATQGPPKDDNPEEYKRRICEVLNVDYNKHKGIPLLDLRMYARAYNIKTRQQTFKYPEPQHRVKGVAAHDTITKKTYAHFALIVPSLLGLAYERGDLFQDGTVPPMQLDRTFDSAGKVELEQALGLNPKDFELLPQRST